MKASMRKGVWLVCILATVLAAGSLVAQEKKAPKKKGARRVTSAFYCPKCTGDGPVKQLVPKGGKCAKCEASLVKGRLIWFCKECDKLNFRSAKCTKCDKESKPVVARWCCSKCEWGAAAPRKKCRKCKGETERIVLENATKFVCPKCKFASADEGECPGCKVKLEPKKEPAKKPAPKG